MEKNMIMAEYLDFTMEQMEAENKRLEGIVLNVNLPVAQRKDAMERLEVVELAKEVYLRAAESGTVVSGMRFRHAFYIATNHTVEDCKEPGVVGKAVNFTDGIAYGMVHGTKNLSTWIGSRMAAWGQKK
jgi:hypothetical protein